MANEKALVAVNGGAIMESEVISNAIEFSQTGFGGRPISLPKNYDFTRAVKNFCFALPSVANIEIATKDSIYQAVHEYVTKGLDVGKHQCALIVYKDKDKDGKFTGTGQLTVQPQYFGQIAQVKRARPDVKSISEGTVIYAGEKVALKNDAHGNLQIKHEMDFGCWNKEIVGAYATVTFEDGSTHSELMTITEIKQAWAQSRNGDKVHKAFPSEMARKTVLNRLCKKLLNKSNDLDDIEYEEEQPSAFEKVVDIDSVEDYSEPCEAQEHDAMPEPQEVAAPPAESATEQQGDPNAEDYCITVKYAEYKDKYADCVTGVYDRANKCIPVYPNKKKTAKGDE